MSTGSNYANTSVAARPILAPGATTQFKTWSSIDQELAASRCPPTVAKRPQSVARSARKYDRASILDRVIAFFVAAIFGIIGAGSLIIGTLYWFI